MFMDLNNGDNICIKEVNENLKRVMNDQPLTRPLSQLRNNCNFVKLYNEYFDVINEDKIKERLKVSRKKYNQKPEVKERLKVSQKKYNQKPEVKERLKKYNQKYNQKPEVKERVKKYNQKPEVKERVKKYNQKPEVKERVKKYNQKPEVKERLKKYYLLNRATISIKRKEKYLKDKQPTKEVKGATQ